MAEVGLEEVGKGAFSTNSKLEFRKVSCFLYISRIMLEAISSNFSAGSKEYPSRDQVMGR